MAKKSETDDAPEVPRTLDDFQRTPRSYVDRMLKPQNGMGAPRKFGSRDFWICPTCKAETFDPKVAKAHKC